ncbi:MAG: hypothetical protein IPO58_03265 [Betaproteobacteria bacterium]|nr:hypothetical protein [Betaproteobacteria bacterium]
MISYRLHKGSRSLLLVFLFATTAQAAQTDITTVPLETYAAPSSTDVKPNVLFVLDDSGSMDWDFMPDWACVDQYLHPEFRLLEHRPGSVVDAAFIQFQESGLQRHLLQSGNQL